MSDTDPHLKPGRYRHFKGDMYTVLGVGQHTETGEYFVVYRGDHGIRLRPYAMFVEHVDKPEYQYQGPRFAYLGEASRVNREANPVSRPDPLPFTIYP